MKQFFIADVESDKITLGRAFQYGMNTSRLGKLISDSIQRNQRCSVMWLAITINLHCKKSVFGVFSEKKEAKWEPDKRGKPAFGAYKSGDPFPYPLGRIAQKKLHQRHLLCPPKIKETKLEQAAWVTTAPFFCGKFCLIPLYFCFLKWTSPKNNF